MQDDWTINHRASSIGTRPESAKHNDQAALTRHSNNFTALRFIAASLVIITHAYAVSDSAEAFGTITNISIGWSAVVMFFAISGFLITNSLDRRDIIHFTWSRILRIFPGLIICTLVTAFLLGFISTISFADYIRNYQTLRYIFGNSTLLATEYSLPGVFQSNPLTEANGSLWTLRYEVFCYALFAILLFGGALPYRLRRIIFFVITAAFFAYYFAKSALLSFHPPVQLENTIELGFPFLIGSWYASAPRFRITIIHVSILCCLVYVSLNTVYQPIGLGGAIAGLTLWLAFVPNRLLKAISNLPDYSYGIYIYAYPIQQTLYLYAPTLPPLLAALISLIMVLIPASLSWHLIEKPALSLKGRRGRAKSIDHFSRSCISPTQTTSRMSSVIDPD